ncbi:hypothetical protein M441DRAFT_376560 [Trichoderma asperellum CBS 433.97]|uniref:Uncharacterized protein n=1 Tax=Trichoderma asperellum (strain ATCC 204424 / CBS 433.97 / NBRC 101777) TaxID=1042311 RepID=A0A2T3ZFS6_TRIA4|nr:hypothetical protein M441DRAFT_376560 [Trichoderma asperellum CBS 433.97]PTB43650.1 hypothetical protein M441DRAFT_376560 [Trichoderma asperellum CBS 433.97]WVH32725.1 hypothetical protein [Trichoderma asperellum]
MVSVRQGQSTAPMQHRRTSCVAEHKKKKKKKDALWPLLCLPPLLFIHTYKYASAFGSCSAQHST